MQSPSGAIQTVSSHEQLGTMSLERHYTVSPSRPAAGRFRSCDPRPDRTGDAPSRVTRRVRPCPIRRMQLPMVPSGSKNTTRSHRVRLQRNTATHLRPCRNAGYSGPGARRYAENVLVGTSTDLVGTSTDDCQSGVTGSRRDRCCRAPPVVASRSPCPAALLSRACFGTPLTEFRNTP
jgi:hypothetical protein